ncbi:hypothetical protein [Caenimonas soli]|uniref:hypothetical protein n=1 Tax=Caenimonas soli TaxID=2735555 RepID=UPI0015531496|nr:hypothetical protein [Caenimonas soli]NPC59387.1 hypothetical protein [Caenimonas soli]
MNAELSSADGCRIACPRSFVRNTWDCLQSLTRNGEPAGFQNQERASRFDYEDLDTVIGEMRKCNEFERSTTQFKLVMPGNLAGA